MTIREMLEKVQEARNALIRASGNMRLNEGDLEEWMRSATEALGAIANRVAQENGHDDP